MDRQQQDSGFSLVELNVVALVMCIVAGFALINITGILPRMNAEASLNQTVAQLRTGRELSMAQRRNIELRFVENNQIELSRIDIPSGRTVLSTVTLENGFEFRLFDGIPDTPDSFGNGSAVDFGASSTLIFLSDGTLVNSQGDPLSGTVFLGLEEHPETARAVTILGATGRVRGYRWTGSSWIH